MPYFFVYLIKLSISLGLVYIFYRLVLRKLTYYTWNRYYLLGYGVLSFFIASINITPWLQKRNLADDATINLVPTLILRSGADSLDPSSPVSDSFSWLEITTVLIVAGMIMLIIRLLLQYMSFLRIRAKAELISHNGMRLYQVDADIIPFSFGNSIFINKHLHTDEELEKIIRHEFVHVRQKHSIDILFSEILCILNWYNPFAWLIRKAIRQNLEFIADHKVVSHGIDKKQYQYLLLKVIGNNQFSIASKFNFSSLKKRIAMMNKLRSTRISLTRFLFILPLIAVILISFRQQMSDSIPKPAVPLQPLPPALIVDTIPGVNDLNSKGYILDVITIDGKSTVVVRDKDQVVLERIPLERWKKDSEKFERKYGEIQPPLPPTPPPAPVLPTAEQWIVAANPDVRDIAFSDNQVSVTLKDGRKEKYDLDVKEDQKAFQKKYGDITTVAVPAITKAPLAVGVDNRLSNISREFEITNKSAWLKLLDGTIEKYNLEDPKQREAFESKYGKIINTNENINMNGRLALASTTPVVAVNGHLIATPSPDVVTVAGSRLSTASVSPVAVSGGLSSTTPAPSIIAEGAGTTVIAPMAASAEDVMIIDDYGYSITGKEDILVTITRNTTKQELDKFVKQMKEKGIELTYDEIEYNSKGHLIAISGTMKSADGRSNFNANGFETLILAMIRNGDKTYFKVSVKNKEVI